jgi:hypothetical protein
MRETEFELRTTIVEAVRAVEPRLNSTKVTNIVEDLRSSTADLTRLARTLRRDPSVLVRGGAHCAANIEPLIKAVQDAGGRIVVMPKCGLCERNASETYSRQLGRRICRACARERWANDVVPCSSCGRVRRFTYRARKGGALCPGCPPEPDVDHAAKVREGLADLKTGLDVAVIDSIVSTFQATTVALRDLNWTLHDTPGVFTGEQPHVSARSVRLAEMLIAAGASGIRTPICPKCSRKVPLRATLDGLRCCHRCWQHRNSRGMCARCGKERHLTNHHGAGERICGPCFTSAAEHNHECTGCGRVAFIAHRRDEIMLCRRCYRGPTATCSSCGRERPCDRVKTGKPICQPCAGKQRTKQICSECGNLRLVHVRTDAGQPVCNPCARKREPCSRCGNTRAVVARLDTGPLCERCLETEPAYFVDCVRCGRHGRAYHHGMCNDCACPGVLARLFCDDGEAGYAVKQIIHALLQSDSAAVLRWAERTELRHATVRDIRSLGDTLDHAALDELPPSKSVEWLRNILVSARVLPDRDRFLRRTEVFLARRVEGIDNPDDRAAVRSFMEWHHLRKLRAQAARGPLRAGHGSRAQTEVGAIAAFLSDLNNRDMSLATCTQARVDDWLVANPTRLYINQFLRWATKRGHAHGIAAPTPPDRRTRRTLDDGDDERWNLIQRLIEDDELETRDRVAGLLVLLYSQQTARLVTLRTDCVAVDENDCCTIALGTVPLKVPPLLADLLSDLVAERHGYAAVNIGVNPWLFPGGRTGQHMSPQRMGARLRNAGVSPQLSRNTALITLAGELPAVVMAKLLGFSVKRAVTWNAEAGNVYPGYAAAVSRRTSRLTGTST